MNRRRWEAAIWIGATALLLLTARQLLHGNGNASGDYSNNGNVVRAAFITPALVMFEGDSLDSAVANVVTHDVFRLERKPATVAYSNAPAGVVGAPTPVIPAIRIALQGTIGGPPWSAILSGIPGHEGTVVVSAGDTLGGVSIRRVNRDSVIVRVKDSTWAVTIARAGL
jgi:hypothetical protein